MLWTVSTFRVLPPPWGEAAIILFDTALAWFICTGIAELAAERSNPDFGRSATNRRGFVVAALLLQLPVVLLAFVSVPVAASLAVALVIFTLIVWSAVLLLIWRAAAEL